MRPASVFSLTMLRPSFFFSAPDIAPRLRPVLLWVGNHASRQEALPDLVRVLSARRGLTVEGGATIRSSPILFRSVLLPLSEDGVAIDHVLGATNHRALRAGESASREAVRTLWL